LKSLSLSPAISDQVMAHDEVRRFKFRLNKLSFGSCFYDTDFHKKIENNVAFILNTNRHTLVDLELADWVGFFAIFEVFNMTKLRNFAFNIMHFDDNRSFKHLKNLTHILSVRRVEVKSKPDYSASVMYSSKCTTSTWSSTILFLKCKFLKAK
jgi:hypothetical protein